MEYVPTFFILGVVGTVEHAYSHGALDLTRKVLDLAQAWIDKEGIDT